MAVYVDTVRGTIPSTKYPYSYYCHMWADTLKELHAMAKLIGHKSHWFQSNKPEFQHYDLTPSRRALAVKYGAVEQTKYQLVAFVRQRRKELCQMKQVVTETELLQNSSKP